MTTQKVFTWSLLLGQAAFLLATITHVAFFFSAFDHSVIEPYAIAIAIDGFIALFSYALIHMANNRIAWYKILPVFTVVALLSVLSIYINGVYNRHFESIAMLSGVNTIPIPIFGDINTLIASCFSFLILAYTFVGNNISTAHKGETLEEKATRLENEKVARQRIKEANKGKFTEKVKDIFTFRHDIKEHIKTINTPSLTVPITPERMIPAPSSDILQDTDKLSTVASNGHTDVQDDFTSFINMLKQ